MDLGFLSEAANSEYVNQILSTDMQVKFSQYIVLVSLVWRFMKKTVDSYIKTLSSKVQEAKVEIDQKLNSLTSSIDRVAKEMSEFRAAMERVETNHEKRLGTLENRMDSLSQKLPPKGD
jgi:hypothetical protein